MTVLARRSPSLVTARRSLVGAGCLALAAVAALTAGIPPAIGSSPRSAAAARFDPVSVTFVSLDTGWVLGMAPCKAAGGCLALRETTDAGRSWFARPLPAVLVAAADRKVDGELAALYGYGGLNVRFADPSDGWIYGDLAVPAKQSGVAYVDFKAILWSTHDGGLVWHTQPLGGLGTFDSIFDLEAARGTAYLAESNTAAGVTVKSSPVGAESWHVSSAVALPFPAGGSNPSATFVLAGSSGWLVEGNDRGTTGSVQLASDGQWVGLDAALRRRGPQLRDPRGLDARKPCRGVRTGWLRLSAIDVRSSRRNTRLDLALLLERRRQDLLRRTGAGGSQLRLHRSSCFAEHRRHPDRSPRPRAAARS